MSKVKKLKRKIRSLQAANVNILHRLERLEKAVTGDVGARGEIHVDLVTKVISDEIERDLFKPESAPTAEQVLASVAEFKPEVREELAVIRGLEKTVAEPTPVCGDPGVVCDWCDQDAEYLKQKLLAEPETVQDTVPPDETVEYTEAEVKVMMDNYRFIEAAAESEAHLKQELFELVNNSTLDTTSELAERLDNIGNDTESITDQIGAMVEEALAEAEPVYVGGRRQDWTFIDPPKGGGYMDVIGFDANGSPVGEDEW